LTQDDRSCNDPDARRAPPLNILCRDGSQFIEPSSSPTALAETSLEFRRLTVPEAVGYLVGTNVGAAVLALPYACRHAGFAGAVIACVLATVFSLTSHLYVAEAMLRTTEVTQLTGLFRRYLFPGRAGRPYLVFLFVVTIGVAIPTLAAYVLGGGSALAGLTGVDERLGQALFLLAGAAVVWLGLKTTGFLQKLASLAMAGVLASLVGFSFSNPAADFSRAATFDLWGLGPVIPVAVFTCLSQAVVPEITRGLSDRPALIPRVIRWSLGINLAFSLLVTLSIFLIVPPEGMAQLATDSWGRALGTVGLRLASAFAFFALITSFWGTAGTLLTNVVDLLRFPSEWHLGHRVAAYLITIAPAVILVVGGFWGFVQLVQIAGAAGGIMLALLPILVLRRARRRGDRTPEYAVASWLGAPVQVLMLVFYVGALVLGAIAV
jgi:tyrosine-specific transport protein